MAGPPHKAITIELSKHLKLIVAPHGSSKTDVWVSTPMRHPVTGEDLMGQWMERRVVNDKLEEMKKLLQRAISHDLRVQAERNK